MRSTGGDRADVQARRRGVVAPAQRWPCAREKEASKRTEHDEPVHSLASSVADLGTIVKNRIQPTLAGAQPCDQITRPTPQLQRTLDLLQLRP